MEIKDKGKSSTEEVVLGLVRESNEINGAADKLPDDDPLKIPAQQLARKLVDKAAEIADGASKH